MFFEKNWERWADKVRQNSNVPLRVEFWNGRVIDFGNEEPKVIIRIPHISALPYLFFPTVSNLSNAYVEGKIDLEGSAHHIIEIGNALLKDDSKLTNKVERAIRESTSNKEKNRQAIQYHYDVSNDFYNLWLDKNMVYSCAYFE